MMARIATTVPSIFIASARVKGRIIAGSLVTRLLEVMALRPQQRRHDGADDAELHQTLGEIGQRLPREQPRQARAG